MSREFFSLLTNFSSLSILLPLCVGVYRSVAVKPSRLSQVQNRIFVLVLVGVFFELLAQSFSLPIWEWLTGESRNLPGAHLFTVVQFGLFVWIYKELIGQWSGKLWVALIIVFALIGLANGLYYDGFRNLNPTTRALEAILLLIVIIGYFYNLLRQETLVRLEREPLFWTSAGLVIYLSGSLLVFLVSNIFLSNEGTYDVLWALFGIHSLLNILLNLSLAMALWIRYPK
ncbi:MAG: hypothetical protein AAFP08_11785 [Bacteroidota bacterium]